MPYRLVSLPQATIGDRALQGLDWVRPEYAAVVGLGLVMASLIAYALVRRSPAGSSERLRLVRVIASLDAAFEAGEIGRDEYDQARQSPDHKPHSSLPSEAPSP